MFDTAALFAALDEQRQSRRLDWNQLALDLYQQSSELNAQLRDHAL